MNIWHNYARHYNFGDYGLGVGVRNIFSKHLVRNKPLIYKLKDVHTFNVKENLYEINNTSDMLLIGGGGIIHGCFFKSGFWTLDSDSLKLLNKPFVVYGVGYNLFRGEGRLSSKQVDNLREIISKSCSFSVRNDGSREELLTYGIDVPEVPDPGFFIDMEIPKNSLEENTVIIQLAADLPINRGISDSFMSNMELIIRHLISKEYKVILAPHVRSDIELGNILQSRVKSSNLISWTWDNIMRDEFTLKGFSFYKNCKFVIGMRGHSQIFSVGVKKPVISIGNHRKNLGLLEKISYTQHYIDIADKSFLDKAISNIEDIEKNYSAYTNLLEDQMSLLDSSTKSFIEKIRY